MATQIWVELPEETGGGGGGVTSINGATGPAINLVQGTGISIGTVGNSITISNLDAGTVTAVTASTPLFSSGGSAPNITIQQATTSQNGFLSSVDWNTFNNKQPAGSYITSLTGDVTGTGPGATATTLATVNANVGSFGSSTAIPNFTVNAKGLITAAGTSVVIAPAGTLTGTTLNSTVVSSSLTSVGTITSGVWNGTAIAIANGGTGQTTAANAFIALSPLTTAGDIIYENNTPAPARLPIGTTGQVLTVVAGLPAWQTVSGTGTVTSVALALPVSVFTVSGSPVTTSGTLTGTFTTQTANTVFSGPTTGGAATPTFRALVAADIPSISLTTGVTGVLPIANGGTNNSTAFTAGSVIFSNGTSLTQDNANFFWNDTNFSLGISNNTPAAATFIDAINTSGATKRVLLTGYGTASLVGFRSRLARGTLGTPTAVQTGDILGFYNAEGYGASQFPASGTGAISIIAGENFTNTSNLTYVTINSTPTGSVTSAENFRVASTGLTIGPQSSSTLVHQANGGWNETTRTITGNLTVDTTTTDYIIFANTSGGVISITLPAPTNGRVLIIKDSTGSFGTNNCTIVRHGSELIEGLAASKVLQTNWGSTTFTSDGTNWFMI